MNGRTSMRTDACWSRRRNGRVRRSDSATPSSCGPPAKSAASVRPASQSDQAPTPCSACSRRSCALCAGHVRHWIACSDPDPQHVGSDVEELGGQVHGAQLLRCHHRQPARDVRAHPLPEPPPVLCPAGHGRALCVGARPALRDFAAANRSPGTFSCAPVTARAPNSSP